MFLLRKARGLRRGSAQHSDHTDNTGESAPRESSVFASFAGQDAPLSVRCCNSSAFRLARDVSAQHKAPRVAGGGTVGDGIILGIRGKPVLLAFDDSQSRLAVVVRNDIPPTRVSSASRNHGCTDRILIFGKNSVITVTLADVKPVSDHAHNEQPARHLLCLQFIRGGRYFVAADSWGYIYVWHVMASTSGGSSSGIELQLDYLWNIATSPFDTDQLKESKARNLMHEGIHTITALCAANTGRDIYVAYKVSKYGTRISKTTGEILGKPKLLSRVTRVSAFRLSDGFRRQLYVPPISKSSVPIVNISDNPWHPRYIALTYADGDTIIIDATEALACYIAYLDASKESNKDGGLLGAAVSKIGGSRRDSDSRGSSDSVENKTMMKIASYAFSSSRDGSSDDMSCPSAQDGTDRYSEAIVLECDISKIREMATNSEESNDNFKQANSSAWLTPEIVLISALGSLALFNIKKSKGFAGFVNKITAAQNAEKLIKPISIMSSTDYSSLGGIGSLSMVKTADGNDDEVGAHSVLAICKVGLLRIVLKNEDSVVPYLLSKSVGKYSMKAGTLVDEAIVAIDTEASSVISINPSLTPGSSDGIAIKREKSRSSTSAPDNTGKTSGVMSSKEQISTERTSSSLIMAATLRLCGLPPIALAFAGFPSDTQIWEFQQLLNTIGDVGFPRAMGLGSDFLAETAKSTYLLHSSYHTNSSVNSKEPILATLHSDSRLYFWKLLSNSCQYFYLELKDDITSTIPEDDDHQRGSAFSPKDIVITDKLDYIAVRLCRGKKLVVSVYKWIGKNEAGTILDSANRLQGQVDTQHQDIRQVRDIVSRNSLADEATSTPITASSGSMGDVFAQLDDVVDQVLDGRAQPNSTSTMDSNADDKCADEGLTRHQSNHGTNEIIEHSDAALETMMPPPPPYEERSSQEVLENNVTLTDAPLENNVTLTDAPLEDNVVLSDAPLEDVHLSNDEGGSVAPPALPPRSKYFDRQRIASTGKDDANVVAVKPLTIQPPVESEPQRPALPARRITPITAKIVNKQPDAPPYEQKQYGNAKIVAHDVPETLLKSAANNVPLNSFFRKVVDVYLERAQNGEAQSIEKEALIDDICAMDVRAGILAILWATHSSDGVGCAVITVVNLNTKTYRTSSLSFVPGFKSQDVVKIRIVKSFLADISTSNESAQYSNRQAKVEPRMVVCIMMQDGSMFTVCEPMSGYELNYGCAFLPLPSIRGDMVKPHDLLVYPSSISDSMDIIVTIYAGAISAFTVALNGKTVSNPRRDAGLGMFGVANPENCPISKTIWTPILSGGEIREVLSCSRLGPSLLMIVCENEIQVWVVELCKCAAKDKGALFSGVKTCQCGIVPNPALSLLWKQSSSIFESCMDVMSTREGWIYMQHNSLSFSRVTVQVDGEVLASESADKQKLVGIASNAVKQVTNSKLLRSNNDISSAEEIEFLASIRDPSQPRSSETGRLTSDIESQRDIHGKLIAGLQERGEKLAQLQQATSQFAARSKNFAEKAKALNK